MKKKTTVSKEGIANPENYLIVLDRLRTDVRQTQLKAVLSVTKEVVLFYWRTGNLLSEMISQKGWGAKTLQRLSRDLIKAFPDVKGFSLRNLQYMKKFAENYPESNCAAAAAQLPWGHNMVLLDRLNDLEERLWYVSVFY